MDESHLSAWSRELYEFSRQNWGLVGGLLVTFWLSAMWSFKKFLNSDYMPRREIVELVSNSTKKLEQKLEEHEKREFARYAEYQRDNKETHSLLLERIEDNHKETTGQIHELIKAVIGKHHE